MIVAPSGSRTYRRSKGNSWGGIRFGLWQVHLTNNGGVSLVVARGKVEGTRSGSIVKLTNIEKVNDVGATLVFIHGTQTLF